MGQHWTRLKVTIGRRCFTKGVLSKKFAKWPPSSIHHWDPSRPTHLADALKGKQALLRRRHELVERLALDLAGNVREVGRDLALLPAKR